MMTTHLRTELVTAPVGHRCCRKAELAAILRVAGGCIRVGGRVVVEARVASPAIANRLCSHLIDLYGHRPSITAVGDQFIVRVVRDAEVLARQAGLVDRHGAPIHGLPRAVVAGRKCDTIAAWRGVVLARGSITSPPNIALDVNCAERRVAEALANLGRRINLRAQAREVRGSHRVTVRGSAVTAVLALLGAPVLAAQYEQDEAKRASSALSVRATSLQSSNRIRAAQAAGETVARIEVALDLLDDVPSDLLAVAHLRLAHPEASLQELGRLHSPELTKSTVAGRLRRLLALADDRSGATSEAVSSTMAEGEPA